MIGTLRKHQTWLWVVIIFATVVSFVIYFSPTAGQNQGGGGSPDLGWINGKKVTQHDYIAAEREVDLHHFFQSGRWLGEDKGMNDNPMRETYQWLLLIQEQERLGIHVSEDAVTQMAWQMVRPLERMRINSPSDFIKQVLQPHGLQAADFERFVRHFVGIRELISATGLSGKLITPQEIKGIYEREHQEMATEAVFFPASNYLARVSVTPEALSEFYSNRLATYRIPERVQVNYVKFNVSNFLAQAETELKTNLTEMVEANYQRLGTNYFPEAKTPEEAKAKIREQLIRGQALGHARKKALEFANTLVDMKPVRPENLQTLAATNGLTVGVTAPFDLEDGPKDIPVGPEFAKAAFSLTAEDPFGGPVVGQDAVYEIGANKKIPGEFPSLDQVRERVVTEYKRNQALMMAYQAGVGFTQVATNGLAQGKTFSAICADAKVKPVELPAFSLSTRSLPEVEEFLNLNQLKQAAFSTQPGKVSDLVRTRDGSMALYVKAKLPMNEAQMKADLPDFTASLRQRRQEEAFNQWLNREIQKGLVSTPYFRSTEPPAKKAAGRAKS